MVDQILDLFVTSIDAVISWWSSVINSTGMSGLYIVIMSVVLSIGILIRPVLGNIGFGFRDAASDTVRKIDPRNRKVS